jgi:hypothetical protein
MYPERTVPKRRSNIPATSFRNCGTVNAGVHFFPRPASTVRNNVATNASAWW